MYPSIPQKKALDAIYQKLINDRTLSERTKLEPNEIIELLEICVSETYFVFNRKLYRQVKGLAIGTSTSGFAADIYVETIETTALATFVDPPSFWVRFVDDVYANPDQDMRELFLTHLNAQDEHVQWTEEVEKDKKLAYVDTETHRKEDGTLRFTVYRKPTHTDQYLHFTSNHHISNKLSVPKTLLRRADVVTTEEKDLQKEENHITKALGKCGYPKWAVKRKKEQPTENKIEKPPSKADEEQKIGRVCIPYIKHTSERIAKELRKHGAEVIYLPTQKIKNILCSSAKDTVPLMDKAGVIYHVDIPCEAEKVNKKEDYTGETKKATKHRMYEHHVIHLKDAKQSTAWDKEESLEQEKTDGVRRSQRNAGKPKPNYKHLNEGPPMWLTEGNTSVSSHLAQDHVHGEIKVKILGREKNKLRRGIKEAIEIKRNKPTLNKNEQDRYFLSPIYDNLISGIRSKNNRAEKET